jgi:hypothetical protein
MPDILTVAKDIFLKRAPVGRYRPHWAPTLTEEAIADVEQRLLDRIHAEARRPE